MRSGVKVSALWFHAVPYVAAPADVEVVFAILAEFARMEDHRVDAVEYFITQLKTTENDRQLILISVFTLVF